MRLLLVEDQAMVRGALEALLNLEEDIDVVATANNGVQATAFLAANPDAVDIVVTDIQMPELDGIGLCQHIRQHQIGRAHV